MTRTPNTQITMVAPLFKAAGSVTRRSRMSRTVALATSVALLAPSLPLSAVAAQLTLEEGVVVKFGSTGQLVVRDRIVTQPGVTLTSQRDDAFGGALSSQPQSAAGGDWRGLRLEKSAAATGALTLNDISVRFAGGTEPGGVGSGITVRGWSPTLQNLQITDSGIGLRLLAGAAPAISGSSFLRNTTGIDSENGVPSVSGSQFVANSSWGIQNRSTAGAIQAAGNWWGHATGPKQTETNPAGLGDAVSAGVNYSGFLTRAPLINPALRLAEPAAFFTQQTILLDLACINATEFRIAEGNAFTGVAFKPLTDGRGQVTYTASAGDGRKTINVQYRDASGTLATASISSGVLIDTQPPAVSLTNPASGSIVSQPITVEATASDASGITNVEFYLDGQRVATDTSAPYTYNWNTGSTTEGAHTLRAVATDLAGRTGEQTISVTVSRSATPADAEGPVLAEAKLAGTPLTNGATVARSSSVTVSATDRSGVSRVELLLDGVVVAAATGSGTYSATLNLDGVSNGPHTLAWRALDSVGNSSTTTFSISVAQAAPSAPVVTQPTNGSTTRTSSVAVQGTAAAGSSVQLLVNDQPSGSLVTVGSDGRFAATVNLAAGLNSLKATATNPYGTSAASNGVQVTLDTSVPSGPSNLTAWPMEMGKVHLAWTKSTDPNAVSYDIYRAPGPFNTIGEAVKVNTALVTGMTFDDLPPQDGSWTYRVVAVNAARTPSAPSNAVQAKSDGTPPRATIVYAPQGKTDPRTGEVGQGRVLVTVTPNEKLETTPYLSIVPQGGSPITVELIRNNDTSYTGGFTIDANTPSGVANALFSARDAVGNRGTDVDIGGTMAINAAGPVLTNIILDPAAPIKNDPAQTVQATFTFSEPPKAALLVRYALSGEPTTLPVAVSGLTQVNPTTWRANVDLPSLAGRTSPHTLSFSFLAMDELDNQSTKVTAPNRFQIYQGQLPPPATPLGFSAKAQPAGKVKLAWQAVGDAGSYQIYRQAPGQNTLEPLTRTSGVDHLDQTTQSGRHLYAVAAVRQSNGEEAMSAQSAAIEVVASATPPGAPQNLTLQLTGQGIAASWQPPVASSVASYNLYRSSGTSITGVEGRTPLKTGIKSPAVIDANPSPSQSAYVVTALDEAGNESAVSNSAYLNASLLPVRDLKVEQIGNDLPVLTWAAPNSSVSGYLVYVGPDAGKTKMMPSPITSRSWTDTGYTDGERRYTVSSVDASGVELARTLTLPSVTTQIAAGLPVKRGVMNRLQVQVASSAIAVVQNARAVVRVPTNKDSTQFQDHRSEPFTLAPGESKLVSVIVGGYAEMPGSAQAQVGIESSPVEGELIKLARNQVLDVVDGALVIGMSTDEFTRGGAGKVKLTVENTGDVDVELLTATNNGAGDSSELRFKLLDADGNVLTIQPYKQVVGANVVTLTNGLTVARIPAGSTYVSDVFALNVPLASPNTVRVKLEVDKLRYHSGEADQVIIAGRGSEKTASLLDTAYFAEVTGVAPLASFGDEDVVITGRAIDRATTSPLPNTRVKLVLNQQGYERVFMVITDVAGDFRYAFKPTITDSGLYKVSAVHPEITDRPEQKAFTINRVTVGPTPFKLDVPKNYPVNIPFVAKAGPGTSATNLRLVLDPAQQPTGQIPAGIHVQMSAPAHLVERQTLNIPAAFTANNEAQLSGSLILSVLSDERPQAPIGLVKVDYKLSEARPWLVNTPSFVETGLAQGGSQVESVLIENRGQQEAVNLLFALTKADGSTAPGWASIASAANGSLAVGDKRSIDLAFTPPSGTPEGVYEFKLIVSGDNVPQQAMNVYASITQSGQGNVLFKASDIYTATLDKDGRLIQGLAGASVTLQNEEVATLTHQLVTDSAGEALFRNIPAGRYKFRTTASNHQEVAGRLVVKPGITFNQPVFLEYDLITVEWSVREITIQDRYEITLNTTFETDVPAAVVVMRPASVNLPNMRPGEVFYGELTLTNFGLVRADDVQQQVPKTDGQFHYQFLVDVPTTLEPKQRVTIPYRVTMLQNFTGLTSGGGCHNYSNTMSVTCSSECANGQKSTCGASTSWFSVSQSSCPASGGGGGGGGLTDPTGRDGGWPGEGATSGKTLPGKKCVYVPKGGGSMCK
jgi:large repetitive protein